MKRDSGSGRAELPAWSYLLLGCLAPIVTLRLGRVNLTWFDLAVVLVGLLLFWRRVPRRAPGGVVALGYLMVLGFVIATLRAPDPRSAVMHILQWAFIFFVVIPVTYSAGRARRALGPVVVGFLVAMTAVALYGIYEVVFLPKPYRLYRYRSILGSPQLLAFQISVTLPFLIFFLKQVRPTIPNRRAGGLAFLFALGLSGTLVWLLAYSLSRTGAVATAAAVLAYAWLDGKGQRPAAAKLTLPLTLAFLAAAFVVSRQADISEQITTRIQASLLWESPEVADRTAVWQEALASVDPTYYVIGVGPDNYHNISEFGRKPHAVLLLLLVEGGFLVVLAFVLLLAHFFTITLAALRLTNSAFDRDFLVAAIAAMVAYVVIAMLNTQSLSRFYWFVFALGLATASRCVEEHRVARRQ